MLHDFYGKNEFVFEIPNWFDSAMNMLFSPIFIFYSFLCIVFIFAGEKVYAYVKLTFLCLLFLIKTKFKRDELLNINKNSEKQIPINVLRKNKENIIVKMKIIS